MTREQVSRGDFIRRPEIKQTACSSPSTLFGDACVYTASFKTAMALRFYLSSELWGAVIAEQEKKMGKLYMFNQVAKQQNGIKYA